MQGAVKTGARPSRRAALARQLRAASQAISGPQLLALSFLGLIALGTLGFRWLPGLYTAGELGWIDALFMATSAVCVTGLSVVDISQSFTFAGQLWLLALVQAGGLGILTLAGLILASLGRRLGLAAEEGALSGTGVLSSSGLASALRAVVLFTFAAEALGALVLTALWSSEHSPLQALWLGLFHSISAFCNGGFSLFSDSLVGFQREPSVLFTMAVLIIAGSIGFPVVHDLRARLRGRARLLSLHTRLVLGSTLLLLLAPTLIFAGLEWQGVLAGLGPLERTANAFFMAVTPRTAGFNSIDYDAISNPSLLLTITLMWIGGAPASTAGGVKVTTVALLVLVLWARLSGEQRVSLAGRTIPGEIVQRAVGLAAGATLLLGLFCFVLLSLQLPVQRVGDRELLVQLVFEAQSAFSTVGLSMNLTPQLHAGSRLLLVLLMFLGRVGPLVVLSAMALRQRRQVEFRYAHEEVLIG